MKLSRTFWLQLMAICSVLGLTFFSAQATRGQQESQIQSPEHPHYLAQVPAQNPATLNGKIDGSSEKTDDGVYFNVHTLDGKRGEQITIEATSSDFDPYLIVIDSEGNLIAKDDNGGGGTKAKIAVTLPADGTYGIGVFSLPPGESGNYTLSMQGTTANNFK